MDQISIAIQNPSGKNPRCDFMPKKSLEEVLDDLKDMVSFVPTHEPIWVVPNESIVKKKGRYAK